jgi:hypothetical protein
VFGRSVSLTDLLGVVTFSRNDDCMKRSGPYSHAALVPLLDHHPRASEESDVVLESGVVHRLRQPHQQRHPSPDAIEPLVVTFGRNVELDGPAHDVSRIVEFFVWLAPLFVTFDEWYRPPS